MRVVLISTYEMGRQPFGLASPAAWLREAGFDVACFDLSRQRLDETVVAGACLVGFYLPMHTATRLAGPVIDRVRTLAPAAHLCAFGLYASLTAPWLRRRGIESVLAGEFEQPLVALARRIASTQAGEAAATTLARRHARSSGSSAQTPAEPVRPSSVPSWGAPPVGAAPLDADTRPSVGTAGSPHERAATRAGARPSVPRLAFRTPDRRGLPPLDCYAALVHPDGRRRVAGYTEATRGCKHLCRHCPVVPVYGGQFRVVPPAIVLADIRQQVEAGATHITFGDPDFFNGIGHARALVRALAQQFPGLTYDVTIKVEHLVKHAGELRALRETGCVLVTSAIESIDDEVLGRLAKGHTRADAERAIELCREAGLGLAPTFVAFTPWTTLDGYADLLEFIAAWDLVDQVAPIQLALRLLVTAGSRLLELPDVRSLVGPLDPRALVHPWCHPDPRVDALQEQVERLVERSNGRPRRDVFAAIRGLVAGKTLSAVEGPAPYPPGVVKRRTEVVWLDEPWYC